MCWRGRREPCSPRRQPARHGRTGYTSICSTCWSTNPLAHSLRSEELGYLANALLAGCSIQSRPFTPPEAWDAALAVCNLGLENWPARWRSPDARGGCAVEQNLVAVFQVGWTVLHDEVCLPSAGQLIEALKGVRVVDRDTQAALDALRRELTRQWRAGTPWKARDALDVIATLDMTAWAALLGLIDECPVIPAALVASLARSPHAVSPSAFEFISANVQNRLRARVPSVAAGSAASVWSHAHCGVFPGMAR